MADQEDKGGPLAAALRSAFSTAIGMGAGGAILVAMNGPSATHGVLTMVVAGVFGAGIGAYSTAERYEKDIAKAKEAEKADKPLDGPKP